MAHALSENASKTFLGTESLSSFHFALWKYLFNRNSHLLRVENFFKQFNRLQSLPLNYNSARQFTLQKFPSKVVTNPSTDNYVFTNFYDAS